MSKPTVYLAGPITGLSYDGATDWRYGVMKALAPEIDAFSPLRGKNYLLGQTTIQDSYNEHVMSTSKAIFARDHFDCKRCDALFVNLLGAKRVSIGTVMEIAWAHAYGKIVILVMEREGNVHEHSMLREACAYRVETLEEAVDLTRIMLLPR